MLFLADGIAACSIMIGSWHATVVCLSVYPSVTLCIVALQGLKVVLLCT